MHAEEHKIGHSDFAECRGSAHHVRLQIILCGPGIKAPLNAMASFIVPDDVLSYYTYANKNVQQYENFAGNTYITPKTRKPDKPLDLTTNKKEAATLKRLQKEVEDQAMARLIEERQEEFGGKLKSERNYTHARGKRVLNRLDLSAENIETMTFTDMQRRLAEVEPQTQIRQTKRTRAEVQADMYGEAEENKPLSRREEYGIVNENHYIKSPFAAATRQRALEVLRDGRRGTGRKWSSLEMPNVVRNVFKKSSEAVTKQEAKSLRLASISEHRDDDVKNWKQKYWVINLADVDVYKKHNIWVLQFDRRTDEYKLYTYYVFPARLSATQLEFSPGHFYMGPEEPLDRFETKLPKRPKGEVFKGTFMSRQEHDDGASNWMWSQGRWQSMNSLPDSVSIKLKHPRRIGSKQPLTLAGQVQGQLYPAGAVVKRDGLQWRHAEIVDGQFVPWKVTTVST